LERQGHRLRNLPFDPGGATPAGSSWSST